MVQTSTRRPAQRRLQPHGRGGRGLADAAGAAHHEDPLVAQRVLQLLPCVAAGAPAHAASSRAASARTASIPISSSNRYGRRTVGSGRRFFSQLA
jgi:hypothetical protein